MLYALYFRTIDCNRVQSLDYMVRVEVEPGKVRPYKNTNLQQEILSIWLPPTQAGVLVLGNTFIDGAHMVLAGPARGQLHLLYQNSEVNKQFVSYFAEFSAHTYTSISAKKSTSHADVARQSSPPGLMPSRDFGQWTLDGTHSRTGPPLFSVFPTKPTYKIWPSWAW